ncbi:uncharacterized protein CDAR_54211 [Caerostris darwini]|uniref:Uncharacterized protein n=1 Tax=Caerostris darwini TaxID=1538125 RepID=A0AAV4Q507_9ARAC|nr:uncharacterized protein CDAR_54211 [Caerostris darwini]
MKYYPKRRNGDEYYPRGCNTFVVDRIGTELYARDRRGNQFYPRRRHNIFAKTRHGFEYYAKDNAGNEKYPVIQKRSLLIIDPQTHIVKLARFADGTQRYPHDMKGNEYYLREKGLPYLLQNSEGKPYLAKSFRGAPFIPWNYFQEYSLNDHLHTPGKDAAGNTIYVDERNLPPWLQNLVRCMCEIVVICPAVAGIIMSFV